MVLKMITFVTVKHRKTKEEIVNFDETKKTIRTEKKSDPIAKNN